MDFTEMAQKAYDEWCRDQPQVIAIDTETTGIAFYDTPFCVTVAWADAAGGSIPLTSHYLELDDPDGEAMAKIIVRMTPTWVFHNPKFDLQKLILHGLFNRSEATPERIEDTEACAHLLDEHQLKGLKKLAKELLGEDAEETDEIKAARKELKLKKSDGYDLLPRDVLVPYAIKDAEYTLRLYQLLKPQIEARGLTDLYRHEMELCLVLLDMEANGMGVDVEYAETMAKEYNRKILAQNLLIQEITGDEDLNPNSPKQIKEAFEVLGIELQETNKLALRHVEHPLAGALLELRSLSKMHGTYLKPIVEEQRDGIMHPWFRQHRTVTGRMASGGVEDA